LENDGREKKGLSKYGGETVIKFVAKSMPKAGELDGRQYRKKKRAIAGESTTDS